MLRAQGILKRWQEEKLKDTDHDHVAPLEYVMELQYKKYTEICYWCHEKTLIYSKWLSQKIVESPK